MQSLDHHAFLVSMIELVVESFWDVDQCTARDLTTVKIGQGAFHFEASYRQNCLRSVLEILSLLGRVNHAVPHSVLPDD